MKKALSLILALVMLLGMMPMQAFATEATGNADDAEILRQLARETSFPLGNISGNIAVLGDSTISGYPKYSALSTYFSVADGYTITDISKAGDTIVGQLNKWKALSVTEKSALNYVFVQIGLNDTDETAETFRAQYTSLIAQIRADAPDAMLILGTMVPCKQRWKVLYPNTWEEHQERWEIANEDIQNGYYDCDSVAYLHTEALGLDGNLRKEYNHGDHIHENAEGAKVIAYSWYLAAFGHSHRYSSIVTSPTCTEPGYTTYTCACGDSYVDDVSMDITDRFKWNEGYVISAFNGNMMADKNWVASDYVDISAFESIEIVTGDTVNANTTLGIAFYDANKKFVSGVVHTDKTGTEYGILVHNLEVPQGVSYLRTTWYSVNHGSYNGATLHTFYCKGAGTAIPPLGHDYVLTEETKPNCSAGGTKVYICSRCGESTQETTSKGDHAYDNGICIGCGSSILGNDWIAPNFAEGDYSMVVLPDTQKLVTSWEDTYYEQMQWIADNEDALNIQAVLHMGDMVDNNTAREWTICEAGTDILQNAGIPWMPMRGNHDDADYFNNYYDYTTYGTNQSWFGGAYHSDKLEHTYWCVTVGQREYMILSLGWAPSWDVLAWAQDIVEAHSDKNVILTCHAYMNSDGTLLDSSDAHCPSSYHPGYPDGDDVWDAFKGYENVVLAMGGHIHSANIVTFVDQNGTGRDVTSLLVDRQNDDMANHYGMVAVLTFHNGSNTVDVNWYSVRYDALYRAKNQFSIDVPHVHSHEYVADITVPTCTEQGYTTYTCECGESYVDDFEDATGEHTYENGICIGCGREDPDYVLHGELDGDGEVTDWDAILLNRYLAGWKVTIDLKAADIDGDSEVADWDSILLDRYLAGWDIAV